MAFRCLLLAVVAASASAFAPAAVARPASAVRPALAARAAPIVAYTIPEAEDSTLSHAVMNDAPLSALPACCSTNPPLVSRAYRVVG